MNRHEPVGFEGTGPRPLCSLPRAHADVGSVILPDERPIRPPHDPDSGVMLRGFSGARLEIVARDGRGWVRKSAVEGGNDRLDAERRKLGWLAALGTATGLFEIPRAGGWGLVDGRMWYEIEYAPSRSAESVAAADGHAGGIDLGIRLGRIVASIGEAARPPDASTHTAFLRAKLRETVSVLPARCAGSSVLHELGDAFAWRAERLERGDLAHAGDAAARCGGGCHGDLALDNALVDRAGRLVLIDPLANGSESTLWDAAKVLQSSLACWCSIKSGAIGLDAGGFSVSRPGGLAALHGAFLGSMVAAGTDERAIGVHLIVTLARVMRYVEGLRLGALLAACNELMDRLEAGRVSLHEPLDSLRGTIQPIYDGGAEVSAGDAGRTNDAGARGAAVRRVG